MTEKFFDGSQLYGQKNLLERPWEEVVYPGSPYFINGVLPIRLTMEPITREEEDTAYSKHTSWIMVMALWDLSQRD